MKKSYWVIFGFVLFVLILIIVIGIFLLSNKSDALSGDQMEMANQRDLMHSIAEIFKGSGQEDRGWVGGVMRADSDVVLAYHFYPPQQGNFENKLSTELAPKIRKFYKNISNVRNLIFSIRTPKVDEDEYRNWMPTLSFEFDRYTFRKINWIKFNTSELLKYAQNIKWFDLTS